MPPTLPGGRVLGSVFDIRRDYLGTIARAAREVGALTRVVAGPPGWRVVLYVVGSPELAAEILHEPTRYGKGAPGYREFAVRSVTTSSPAKMRPATDKADSWPRSSLAAGSSRRTPRS